jgi:hypothetical protein
VTDDRSNTHSAIVIELPVIRRMSYDLDFIEQSDRELATRQKMRITNPPRCRQLLVINNDRAEPTSAFEQSARASRT